MKKIFFAAGFLLLGACSPSATITVIPEANKYPDLKKQTDPSKPKGPPAGAFNNSGDPERFLDSSLDLVTMSLGSRGALGGIIKMVRQDPPTLAQLNCSQKEALCMEARSIFANQRIPTEFSGDYNDNITLVYERVIVRDCDPRFVDNTKNPYNTPMESLGCSVATNGLQMISDKRQVTDPSLMDLPDAEKAVQNQRRYQTPPSQSEDNRSLLQSISPQ